MAFCRIATRTTTETKKKKKLWLYVFVLLTVLSNNPNLHLLPLICDCRELGLCINYSRFARSPPGPEDTGNYSLWQRGSWIPADRETCWWGHNFPPKTFALTLIKPQATSILRPPFAIVPLHRSLLLPSLRNVNGCEKEEACLSFSPLSVGGPLKAQQHFIIIILPPLPPKGPFSE